MRTRRLYWLVPLLLVALVFQQAHKAYAHFPASDGDIDAVLHIEPDDSPAPGTPQTVYLILTDLANRFRLSNCACNLSISQGQKVLYYSALVPPPAGQPTIYSTSGLPFTFPTQGSYTIEATGNPLTRGVFQPFKLSWQIHVNQPPNPAHGPSLKTFLTYFGAFLAVFAIVGLAVFAAA